MEIDITPHTSLLGKIGHASFSIWQSISELIANSLDAIPEEKKAEIHVEADMNHISVKDNGMGMTQDVLEKAVRIAWPMQELRPYGSKAKSVFGLGMKTACASLGRIWSVSTLPEGSEKGFKVTFDLEKFTKVKSQKWVASMEEIEPSKVGLERGVISGTVVNVERLKVKPIADKLKKDISLAYLPHIKTGDKFYVNGEILREEPLELIENTKVDVDFEVEGVKIHGWGALAKIGSITNFGFHWYRRGQLVEAFDKSFIPNHPTYRQIIGELFADKMPVNFTKKGFEKESSQWKQAREELREKFKNLLKEAKKTRRERQTEPLSQRELKRNEEIMGRVGTMVAEVFDAEPPDEYILSSVIEGIPEGDAEEVAELIEFSRRYPIKVGDTEIRWKHRFGSFGEEGSIVDYHCYALGNNYELLVITNKDSPFCQLIENDAILAVINVADAISLFLIDKLSFDYIKAKNFRDTWLVTASAYLKEIE